MKKSVKTSFQIIGVLSLFLITSCHGKGTGGNDRDAASLSPGDTASIYFTEFEHNFGKVTAGEKVAYLFTYGNRGTIPLVITSASTTCGCTVSKYTTKPLQPGKTGTMKVTFDTSGRKGKQSKTITVRSNATKQVVFLKITCDVVIGNNN